MIRQRYRLIATIAAAGLVLAAAACSSSSSSPGGGTSAGGKVTISVDCAPTSAQNPPQHKEWLEDVAAFEKANPNITIDSVYNYPCWSAASFTAMLRAGNEPNLFYSYFTDLPQVLLAGQGHAGGMGRPSEASRIRRKCSVPGGGCATSVVALNPLLLRRRPEAAAPSRPASRACPPRVCDTSTAAGRAGARPTR